MTIQMIGGLSVLHIHERLCDFDPRNPDYADRLADYEDAGIELPDELSPGCGCNNCFYGRSSLANALMIAGAGA